MRGEHGAASSSSPPTRASSTTWPTASAATPCSPTSCCTSPPSTASATSSRSGCCTPTSRRAARSSTSTRSCRSPSRSGWTRPRCARRSPTAATWPRSGEDGATAQALGATGVPFFVVDRKYGAAGRAAGRAAAADPRARLGRRQPARHRARRRRLRRRQLRRLSQPSRRGTARSAFSASASSSRTTSVAERSLVTRPDRLPGVERGVRRVAGAPALDHQLAGVRRRPRSSSSRPCHSRLKSLTSARPGQRSGQAIALRDVERAGQHRLVAAAPPAPAAAGGGALSPSVQDSSGVPIQTPAAPATSAAAIAAPGGDPAGGHHRPVGQGEHLLQQRQGGPLPGVPAGLGALRDEDVDTGVERPVDVGGRCSPARDGDPGVVQRARRRAPGRRRTPTPGWAARRPSPRTGRAGLQRPRSSARRRTAPGRPRGSAHCSVTNSALCAPLTPIIPRPPACDTARASAPPDTPAIGAPMTGVVRSNQRVSGVLITRSSCRRRRSLRRQRRVSSASADRPCGGRQSGLRPSSCSSASSSSPVAAGSSSAEARSSPWP